MQWLLLVAILFSVGFGEQQSAFESHVVLTNTHTYTNLHEVCRVVFIAPWMHQRKMRISDRQWHQWCKSHAIIFCIFLHSFGRRFFIFCFGSSSLAPARSSLPFPFFLYALIICFIFALSRSLAIVLSLLSLSLWSAIISRTSFPLSFDRHCRHWCFTFHLIFFFIRFLSSSSSSTKTPW